MTQSSIVIAFSKVSLTNEPSRRVGYDLNEKAIAGATGLGVTSPRSARLHTLYGIRRSRFYERHPCDRRLKKKYASSRREKERASQALHRVSTLIVEKARANNEAIVLERLKGIRYAHQRGNGEGTARRRGSPCGRSAGCNPTSTTRPGGRESRWSTSLRRTLGEVKRLRVHQSQIDADREELAMPMWCQARTRHANSSINIERRGKIRCLVRFTQERGAKMKP